MANHLASRSLIFSPTVLGAHSAGEARSVVEAQSGRRIEARRAVLSDQPGRKSALLNDCTERLRAVVQKSGGTKQVAARAGVALSTLGSYLAGGEMKLTTAMQLCSACDVTLAWLVGDAPAQAANSAPVLPQGLVSIRKLHPDGSELEDILFSEIWLRSRLGRDAADLMALEVQGSAMEPTIRQGDLLLIDTTTGMSSLEMHVVEVQGEVLVRRLERRLDGGIVMRTDNERFPSRTIENSERDHLKLVGRVIWKGSAAPL